MKYLGIMELAVVMAVFSALALELKLSQLLEISLAALALLSLVVLKQNIDWWIEDGYCELDEFGEQEPCHFDTEPY
ncbi:MAG: hypothetical protein IT292_03690 [Deltaproteobacteria bacterium]|nr:hypothetical protein [Deltaproteobacteria bacterium]